jgi:hypothetical protein
MGWHRPVQETFPEIPPPAPSMRRLACLCGCGCWFYGPRARGRPVAYVNRDHANRARFFRRHPEKRSAVLEPEGGHP